MVREVKVMVPPVVLLLVEPAQLARVGDNDGADLLGGLEPDALKLLVRGLGPSSPSSPPITKNWWT